MSPKIPGCCSRCDVEVYEIVRRDPETHRPMQLGPPLENAVRMTFVLVDGSLMDLTLCAACAAALTPADSAALWQRVMLSWVAESSADHPGVKHHAENGILGLMYSQPWREVRG